MPSLEKRAALFAEAIHVYATKNMEVLDQWLGADAKNLSPAKRMLCHDNLVSFYLTVLCRYGHSGVGPEETTRRLGHVMDMLAIHISRDFPPGLAPNSLEGASLILETRMAGIIEEMRINGQKWGHFALVERPSPTRREVVISGMRRAYLASGTGPEVLELVTKLTEGHFRNIAKIWQLIPETLAQPLTEEPLETQLWNFAKQVTDVLEKGSDTIAMFATVDAFARVAESFLNTLHFLFAE